VRTIRDGPGYRAELAPADCETIGYILATFGPYIQLDPLGYYRTMTDEQVWWYLVSQVCVMGGARHWERMCANPQASAELQEAVSLGVLLRESDPVAHLAEALHQYGATRFANRSAQRLVQIPRAPGVVQDERMVLLEGLSHEEDPHRTRQTIISRCRVFRLKSVSDLMIAIGMSHDVIALDTRVVGFFQKHFGYDVDPGRIQSSEDLYLSLESSLREVCCQNEASLAMLDRVLFRFSGISAIDFVVTYLSSEWIVDNVPHQEPLAKL
jgi:thermostable 8-oxoguanine DNA glycosylase